MGSERRSEHVQQRLARLHECLEARSPPPWAMLRALVGKTSSCGSHGYGLNGIDMSKGAQYKV